MDYSIKIGGEAGQGIQTIGDILAHIFAKAGYYVFTHQDYESRIRGGHNFYQIRFSDRPVTASKREIHLLVALDKESIPLHLKELSSYGQVLYDSNYLKKKYEDPSFLDVPLFEIAKERGGALLTANAVAIGAVIGMLGMPPEIMYELLKRTFSKKGKEIVEANIKAAEGGYKFAKERCLTCNFSLSPFEESKYLISGTEAVGIGAISANLRFYAAYPMTPSTGIFNFIAEHAKDFDIVVEQAEDEIAAINMIIGASYAGVRAMTGTSGGGFALMVEGLSLAGMTETPIVIALAQRPGPATGLPTRTEQGDLLFATFAGHGEFPKIIFAPGSPEQALYLTNKAFDLAEKYQVISIIMLDQYLADSQWSYSSLDTSKLDYKNYRLKGEELQKFEVYKRHLLTETGISPLGIPGISTHLIITDSDEHDEEGHLIEDAETRKKMVEKRLFKKLPLIKNEISPPLIYGVKEPEIILLCWGSLYGIVKEVVDNLKRDYSISMIHFSEIYPFSEDKAWLNLLKKARVIINIEQNATSQFYKLLRMETGLTIEHHINKYDGIPFLVEELEESIHGILKGL
ncbi:MAG: 2-oxoacid:acceptor oxidoreductase subunit alpha [Caldimicrobium sp.]